MTKNRTALFVVIFLFFMWGFMTVLNDILIPHLKILFHLNYVQAMMIQFSFFTAYGLMSIPSGRVVEFIGYKGSLIFGLCVAAIGCILFVPAASIGSYETFLGGLFVLATGIVILQVAANPYVALLGEEKTASSRLNLAQAFNSLGTTLGPQFGSLLILSVLSSDLQSEAVGIEELYFSIAVVLFVIAIVIAFIKLPKIQVEKYENFEKNLSNLASIKEKIKPEIQKLRPIWRFPHLFLGALGIFFYVGAEVSIGSFLVSFLTNPDITALTTVQAGQCVSFYWGAAMVGRFLGFVILLKYSARKVLLFNTLGALVLVFITIIGTGPFVGYTLLGVGLFNSIMFPTIFTLAIAGLEDYTAKGSGILCTAIIGGAIIPLLQGLFADSIGVQYAFFIPFLCYLYIFYYAYRGSLAYCRILK